MVTDKKNVPVMMHNWVFLSPVFEISDLVSLEKRSKYFLMEQHEALATMGRTR